jgi:hypothetical protein
MIRRLKHKWIFFALSLLAGLQLTAQNVIVTGNTTLTVLANTTLTTTGNITINSTGNVDNAGTIKLTGNWTNNGNGLINGSAGTVELNGTSSQALGGSNSTTFYNLNVDNAAGATLAANETASNSLIMTQGNIDAGSNTLTLGTSTSNIGSLSYTAGNILGNFKRWVNQTGVGYIFPVGTASTHHRAVVTLTNLTNGSLTASFSSGDPGSTGLPLSESSYEVRDQFTTGYWTVDAGNGLASTAYAVDLTATGFGPYAIDAQTRVVKRPNAGSWGLNGTHVSPSGSVAKRSAMSGFSQFGLATAVPCVTGASAPSPSNQTVCNSVAPTNLTTSAVGGTAPFSYQWYWNATNTNVGGTSVGAGNGGQTATYTPPTNTNGTRFYFCEITQGACPAVRSATAQVVVQLCCPTVSAPSPSTQSVCVGVPNASITVAPIGGTGPYSYQWYYNTVNNNFSGTPDFGGNGAQTATYTPAVSNVPGTLYFYCVVTQLGCPGVASATHARTVTVCGGPPNDFRSAATPTNVYSLGTCYSTVGDLTNGTVSAEATTSVLSGGGQDLWYKFVADAPGIVVRVTAAGFDALIELQSAGGAFIASENATASGQEILNYYNGGSPLVTGQTYYVAVRNYGPNATATGSFSICLQRLRGTTCNTGVSGYPNFSTCQLLQAVAVQAQSYGFTFTSTTSVPDLANTHTVVTNTTGGFSSVALNTLLPAYSYNVSITATYNLFDAAGTPENITIPPSSACAINITQHPAVFLRSTDQCPTPRSGISVIGANIWVCGAHSYQWTFTPQEGLPVIVNGNPGNRFLAMSAAVAAGLTCGNWDVTIRPRFLAGGVVYSSATPQVKCLNFTCPGGMELEEASEMSTPSVRVAMTENDGAALYPNPNNGQMLNLNITGVNGDQVSVRILDATGRVVYTDRYTTDGTLNKIISFERPLTGGLYMVEMMYDGKLVTERLVVQK